MDQYRHTKEWKVHAALKFLMKEERRNESTCGLDISQERRCRGVATYVAGVAHLLYARDSRN